MRMFFALSLFITSFTVQAQWDVIQYADGEFSNHDLFFQNADTGFVINHNEDGSYVLRTQNGGAAWDSLWFPGHQFRTIYMTSRDTGYIASFYEISASVMRSIDGGNSWQMIATNLVTAVSVPYAISFFNNNSGVITLSGWAAKTENAGVDWEFLEGFPGTRDSDVSDANLWV